MPRAIPKRVQPNPLDGKVTANGVWRNFPTQAKYEWRDYGGVYCDDPDCFLCGPSLYPEHWGPIVPIWPDPAGEEEFACHHGGRAHFRERRAARGTLFLVR